MKRDMAWDEGAEALRRALEQGGAFIVTLDAKGKANPMTIGWGQVGVVWSRPIFTACVRESRYTHRCLRSTEAFTINVPRPGELKNELLFCGTNSGRDVDKAAMCGLKMAPAKAVKTPIGNLPTPDALDLSGLKMPAEDLQQLLTVDVAGWKNEVAETAAYYAKFGSRLPAALKNELDALRQRLG